MRPVGLGVLVLLLALSAGAAAADPPVPVYLRGGYDPGGEFGVLSNDDWRVEARKPTKAHVISVSATGRPELTSPRERQDLAYVWAPTCLPEAQVVTFVRDVVLPGPPSELGFQWDSTGGPFEWASLYVNDKHVYTSRATGRTRIERDKTRGRLALFKDGTNHLEVVVKKRAIPAGAPRNCGEAGVQFVVEGKFAADVAVRTDIPATEVRRVGDSTPVSGAIEIVNNGPSKVYWGRFRFIIGGTFQSLLFVDGPSVAGPGVTGCKSTAPPQTFALTITIDCGLRNMRAGARAVVRFNLIVQLAESAGDGALRYNREVASSADDPNTKNNVLANTILLCTENATNPACK